MIKKIMITVLAAGMLGACSSPQRVVLRDGNTIETRDEMEYNRKTGFYEYEDSEGNKSSVNSSEVTEIREM